MTRGSLSLIATVIAVVTLAGCDSPDDRAPGPPTVSDPILEELLHDKGLRQVRMASGHALTYVLPETGMQILCQSLVKDRWEQLLGGRAGRRPSGGCLLKDEHGMMLLELRSSDDAFTGTTTVAGRPMTVDQNDSDGTEVTVALTDDALQPATHQYRAASSLLGVKSSGHGDPETELSIVRRVLEELVPVLAKETEPLPAIDEQGHLAYVSTPLTSSAEFIDLPTPVQAMQLCTVLIEDLQVVPTEVMVSAGGACRIDIAGGTVTVRMDAASAEPATYQDRVAGRPAMIGDRAAFVTVRLRDDVYVDLELSAPDSVGLAERLVQLLVG